MTWALKKAIFILCILCIACNQHPTTQIKPPADSLTEMNETDTLSDIELTVLDTVIVEKTLTAFQLDSIKTVYKKVLSEIKFHREKLANQYNNSGNDSAQNQILSDAKTYLLNKLIDEVFPAWYGTVWDFNGYCEYPKEGMVACGYFVSTPLKQVGFNLNRFKMAQQYSHKIVKTLCSEQNISTYTNDGFDRMILNLLNAPDDLFVVGLDSHLGFLAKRGDELNFVHSNYMNNVCVESEIAAQSYCLKSSGNFVVGSLFSGNETIIKWLCDSAFVIDPA